MNKSIDELIKVKFATGTFDIPESYERKFEDTIKRINNGKVEKHRSPFLWLANHKVAGVAILVMMLSVVSISSYAAVNMYQKRMNAMPDEVIENYNNDVQNSSVDVDTYSRELMESEEEKMVSLRKQYEENGLFPRNEIKQVKGKEEVVEGGLCFVTEESKFYLPERSLTEEEMLEIIDLQEKRAYSVQKQNSKEKTSQNENNQTIGEMEKSSIAIVGALYKLAQKNLKVISADRQNGLWEFRLMGDDSLFSVYYSDEGVVERVICKNNNLSAHEAGVIMKKSKIKLISDSIKQQVEVFTGKEIKKQSIYCLMNADGEIAYGTISYYCRMSDGSGCVAVYSTAYQNLYDVYRMDNEKSMQDEIKEKEEKAKGSGYVYRLIK